MKPHTALEIAKYIVTRCWQIGVPVSNLKLQNMLYFAWLEYYSLTGKELFADDICAWQTGPVVPDVYYEFCIYAGMPINRPYPINFELTSNEATRLDTILRKYLPLSVHSLQAKATRKNGPWDFTYHNRAGDRFPIPKNLIIEKDCLSKL